MTRAELRRLARIGAEARLEALQREIASIHQAFPDLRRRSTAAVNPYTAGVRSAVAGVREALEGAVTRRRPKMSAKPASASRRRRGSGGRSGRRIRRKLLGERPPPARRSESALARRNNHKSGLYGLSRRLRSDHGREAVTSTSTPRRITRRGGRPRKKPKTCPEATHLAPCCD